MAEVRLRRGDLVSIAERSDYLGNPRPCVIIQAGALIELRDSITICLPTSELIDAAFRVRIDRSASNRLQKTSDVMIDKVLTVSKARIRGEPFGRRAAPPRSD